MVFPTNPSKVAKQTQGCISLSFSSSMILDIWRDGEFWRILWHLRPRDPRFRFNDGNPDPEQKLVFYKMRENYTSDVADRLFEVDIETTFLCELSLEITHLWVFKSLDLRDGGGPLQLTPLPSFRPRDMRFGPVSHFQEIAMSKIKKGILNWWAKVKAKRVIAEMIAASAAGNEADEESSSTPLFSSDEEEHASKRARSEGTD